MAGGDENALLARARLKDEAAVRDLIRLHNRRLFRMARSILRDDDEAEDAVQEAYVKAFTRLAQFREEAAFGTWLCRIVLNEALGRLRRRRAAVDRISVETTGLGAEIIPFPFTSRPADPEQSMEQQQIRQLLERAIDDLPDGFRAVFVARLVEGMSIEETAELFGLKPETVKTRLHRARRLLQKNLEDQLGSRLRDAFPFEGQRCQAMADRVLNRLSRLS